MGKGQRKLHNGDYVWAKLEGWVGARQMEKEERAFYLFFSFWEGYLFPNPITLEHWTFTFCFLSFLNLQSSTSNFLPSEAPSWRCIIVPLNVLLYLYNAWCYVVHMCLISIKSIVLEVSFSSVHCSLHTLLKVHVAVWTDCCFLQQQHHVLWCAYTLFLSSSPSIMDT